MIFFNIAARCVGALFLFYCSNLYAVTATIDADGGANYTSLDTALTDFESKSKYPDTILFVGNNQHTYTMSVRITKKLNNDKILFVGASNSPDSFPVINHTNESGLDFFQKNEITFVKIIFTGNELFRREGSSLPLIFRQCVIRDFTKQFFIFINSGNPILTLFENCQFVNNTYEKGIIRINVWAKHKVQFVNCTFDGNIRLFDVAIAPEYNSDFVLKNCIFSNNGTTFLESSIKNKVSNSLTPVGTSGYGPDCVPGDPGYAVTSSRTKPSDWKISSTSSAKGIGSSVGAPLIDIAGTSRSIMDAGCWAIPVIVKPAITKEPESLKVGVGKNVKFKVATSGSNPQYAWFKVGSTDTLSKADSLSFIADILNDGALYNCVVSNSAGFVTSSNALLTVVKIPIVNKDINDTTVNAGTALRLKIASSGIDLTFQWYKDGVAISESVADSIVFSDVDTSYNGDTVFCVVSNIAGSDTSTKAKLTIIDVSPPNITKEPESLVVQVSNPFTLSISASGSVPLSYTWYKNGLEESVGGDDSVFSIGTVTLMDSGRYQCIVQNAYGSDTSEVAFLRVTEVKPPFNPLKLSGVFINRTQVKLTVSGFSELPYKEPLINIDSIGIWYDIDKYPATPVITSSRRFAIPVSRLSLTEDFYDTIVTINGGPNECFSYHFLPTVFWKAPATIVPFTDTLVSGTKILMCSSVEIANNLVINDSVLQGADSVVLKVSNLKSLNRDSCDYLVISYGSQNVGFIRDTIKVTSIPEGTDTFERTYHNKLFLGDKMIITFGIKILGKYGNSSKENNTDVIVGIERPSNNAVLTIDNIYSDRIDLSWSIPQNDQVDSICLWRGTAKVPLRFDPDAALYESRFFDRSTRSFTFGSLNTGTEYYFAIQIKSNGLWSSITEEARASARTLKIIDTTQVNNTITITNAKFNSNTNTITLTWTIDSSGLGKDALQAGIVYGLDTYPEIMSTVNYNKVITSELIDFSKENVTQLYLGVNQLFDTLYYFSMFMRQDGGQWSQKSDSAQYTLKVTSTQWQEVEYFKNVDSVFVLNNTFAIRKGKGYPKGASIVYKDSIDLIANLNVPDGFIKVSKAFKFRNGVSSPTIDLGFAYDSVPAGHSANDIYLYEYSGGKWYLLNRVAVDSSRRMVFTELDIFYGKSEHRKNPHILLIDKIRPEVTIIDTSEVIQPLNDFVNRISIKDNCANVKFVLKCGPIHKNLTTIQETQLSDTDYNGVIQVRRDSVEIKELNSLRVILIVNDGPHVDTFDISRQVSKSSESVSSRAQKWIPVSMTTELNSSDVETALIGLSKESGWKYDSLQFRLFYWDPMIGDNTNSYVQYSPEQSDLFKMIPGRVFWVKSRTQKVISFGSGKTVSILKPFEITLQAKQWTDFAMPYSISLYLADVFDNSPLLKDGQRDSIWFYQFNAPSDSGALVCSPVYCPPLSEFSSDLAFLKNESMSSYTIYNATNSNIRLRIPPIDTINSHQKKGIKKILQKNEWYFSIKAQTDEDIIAPIYCGFQASEAQKSLIPSPPAPGSVHVNVYDTTNFSKYGNLIYHEEKSGYTYPVVLTNNSSTSIKNVKYSIVSEMVAKKSLKIVMYNPKSKQFETDLSAITISLKPGESAYRWVLVGDTAYFGKFLEGFANVNFALLNVNAHSGHAVRVQFTVPYMGVNTVTMKIVNQLGQVVYSQNKRGITPGNNSIIWNTDRTGGLASGTYILQLSAYDSQRKITGRIQSKFLYMSR